MPKFVSAKGIFGADLQQCAGCHFARYCSRICQRHDWRNGHSLWCPEITRAYAARRARRNHRQTYYGVIEEATFNEWVEKFARHEPTHHGLGGLLAPQRAEDIENGEEDMNALGFNVIAIL